MDSIFCVCSFKAHLHYSRYHFLFSSNSIVMVVWASGPSYLNSFQDWSLTLLSLSYWTLYAENNSGWFNFLYGISTKLLEFDYTNVFLLFYHEVYGDNYFLLRLIVRWGDLHSFYTSFYRFHFCSDQVFYVWFMAYYFYFSSVLVKYFDDNL